MSDEPSDETLERIRKWDKNWPALIAFMREAWSDYGLVREIVPAPPEPRRWEFITGGWSGNEEIIGAFYGNFLAQAVLWESAHRGGKHVLVEGGA
jgi:hypothetical protein